MIVYGNLAEREIADKFDVFLRALRIRQDQYFGDNFYNAGIFVVADFLDPRTIWAIENAAGLEMCKRTLKTLAPVASTRVPPAAARASRAATPGGSFLSSYANPGPVSRVSPLELEFRDYVACLKNEVSEKEAINQI